jgi:hypothetical protein
MHHVVLTDEERAFVRQMSGKEMTEWWECVPCRRLLANPEQGAQLIKGTLQIHLQASGVPGAERVAQAVYTRLRERAAKKPVS